MRSGQQLYAEIEEGCNESVFGSVSSETVLEITRPLAKESPVAMALRQYGDVIYSLTLRTVDLSGAVKYLETKGLSLARDGRDRVVLQAKDAFGMLLDFTSRRIPNDPRS